MKIRFTKKDFEKYQCCVIEFLDQFGITEYSISFQHLAMEQSFARVEFNLDAMQATFSLTTGVDNCLPMTKDIAQIALEEVLHLLLARYCHTIFDSKDINDWKVEAEEHAIINKITRAISQPLNCSTGIK